MKTFALGFPNDRKKVALWCEDIDTTAPKGVKFTCLNGAWDGFWYPETGMVDTGRGKYPAVLLWEGEVPRKHARHYNDAIAWIEAQLSS